MFGSFLRFCQRADDKEHGNSNTCQGAEDSKQWADIQQIVQLDAAENTQRNNRSHFKSQVGINGILMYRRLFWGLRRVRHALLALRLRRVRLRSNAVVAHFAVSGELRAGFDSDFAGFDVADKVGGGLQGKQL